MEGDPFWLMCLDCITSSNLFKKIVVYNSDSSLRYWYSLFRYFEICAKTKPNNTVYSVGMLNIVMFLIAQSIMTANVIIPTDHANAFKRFLYSMLFKVNDYTMRCEALQALWWGFYHKGIHHIAF